MLSLAWPVVGELDQSAFLTLASSSTFVDDDGRSARWECFFALPKSVARVQLEVHAAAPFDRAELGSPRLLRRIMPLLEPGTIAFELWQRGGAAERQVLMASVGMELDPAKALPARFVDSPEALARMLPIAADLAGGAAPGNLVAEHELDAPTWRLEVGADVFRTPFAA